MSYLETTGTACSFSAGQSEVCFFLRKPRPVIYRKYPQFCNWDKGPNTRKSVTGALFLLSVQAFMLFQIKQDYGLRIFVLYKF